MQPQRRTDPDVQKHLRARARLRRGGKRGQENQALGRSRGGFGTNIHVKCDREGHPLDFHLTANRTSDTTQFELLLDSGPDVIPRGVIADKGYDTASNRAAARRHGAVPIIAYRKNTKGRTRFFPRKLYKLRARVEQFIGKPKRLKRVSMGCEKTAAHFAAFVALGLCVCLGQICLQGSR